MKSTAPGHAPESPRVLIVDPDAAAGDRLRQAVGGVASAEHKSDFDPARKDVLGARCDYLVTNLRLREYNGLHLVYLIAAQGLPTRCIVYTDRHDAGLAHEVQEAGAFYETRDCLAITLAAYLQGTLPAHDRRTAAGHDRRRIFRGGRRCWDAHLATSPDKPSDR